MRDNELSLRKEDLISIGVESINQIYDLLPTPISKDVILDDHLYNIYQESYRCLCFSLFDAGIILIGQLLEKTLKIIILLKTGEVKTGTMGSAIQYAFNNNLLFLEDISFLRFFTKKFRNPYTHLNLKEIIGYHPIPIFKYSTGKTIEDLIYNTQLIMKKIREGKVNPHFVDASSDSLLASMVKPEIDKKKALFCAWIAYMKFEEMAKIYIKPKDFENYIEKFGSPYDKIASITTNEDSD
ncbi:hypothetical protein KSK55_06625 [Methanospirillum purgamenti]|uniref:Uncharacterized protein n=1 Tax=Methanospirillum hungatei TaxID=2203 RepID=A0A8F5VQC5_METHU|nr:hypothetical protein [Methanospirillum hungatei]QXO96038.1 hypothetical protein KSK55_06625 [Methanospirillum hungatei]